ncbi:MAG: large conductance mechanosensitive channel protein MscL [Clostridia bacterium]|nr:large conductance mechanosensitive channel protein MscL [Clostridia bacterium]
MKKFFGEFKEFIAKGNVLDMAIGVVIGAAFKAIVTSLVDNIINPLIGLAINTSSLADAKAILKPAVIEKVDEVETVVKEAVTLNYGLFLKSIIDFLIVAFCLFCTLKVVMSIKSKAESLKKKEEEEEEKKEEPKPAEPTPDEVTASTLKEILAVLKENKKQ